MQSQQQHLLVVHLFGDVKSVSLLELPKSTFHERSDVAQQCDGTDENFWLCYLEVRLESHKGPYSHKKNLFNHYNITCTFKKNNFIKKKKKRDLYLLWPDLHNCSKQIKQIYTNVRNPLHRPHVYHVPQGKTEEEINKVTA